MAVIDNGKSWGILMTELKPRFIITSPGRKRRGFGTFFMVLIIFTIGFYAGSKYGGYFFGSEPSDVGAENERAHSIEGKEVISVDREVPGRENMDIIYSGETPGTEDQKSLIEGEFLGPKVPENERSSENTYLNGADQKLLMNEAGNAPEEILTSEFQNNVTADSGNETDTVKEEALTSAGSYTLQVGAFSTPEEARSVADGYKTKGFNAYIVPIENSRGEKWNLVKIGKFDTIDKAWSYSSYFKNREGLDVYVESVEQETVFNESWGKQEASDQQ
jgi:sporulation related protein